MTEPTDHPPGSAGKLEVMRERHEAGLPLWHPDDNAQAIWQYSGAVMFDPQQDVIREALAALAATLENRRAENANFADVRESRITGR